MKNKLQILVITLVLCASFAYAQRPPIAGGYRNIAVTDEGAVAAANFAVETQAKTSGANIKLVGLKKAEQQVVAGRNYSLCMNVDNGDNTTSFFTAVVFLNLQQQMSLTSWESARTCGSKEPMDEPDAQEPVIVGGYSDADKDDPDLLGVANFAVKAGSKKADGVLKFDSIEHARTQVVAGMNYAMCLRVRGKTDKPGKTHLVYAIVYQDLKNKMSLTSFKRVSACPADE
jgi:hypothetical protein